MLLPEDKAYWFWAAEFQTALAANSAYAGMSKGVQCCCQVPSSSSSSHGPALKGLFAQWKPTYIHPDPSRHLSSSFLYLLQSLQQVWCTLQGEARPSEGMYWGGRDRKPLGQSSPCHRPCVWPQQGRNIASLMQKWTCQDRVWELSVWETTKFNSNCTERKFQKCRIKPEKVPNKFLW